MINNIMGTKYKQIEAGEQTIIVPLDYKNAREFSRGIE